MKNLILFAVLFLLRCGDSKEKIELKKLRDSIMIVNHGGTVPWQISAEENARLEENAQRTADSIAAEIEKYK